MSGFGHLNFKLNINVSLEDPHHREISLYDDSKANCPSGDIAVMYKH